MKYYITNCTIIGNINLSSELMDYEEAFELFRTMKIQYKRGLRPKVSLVREDGVIIE